METETGPGGDFIPVAEIEVDAVTPDRRGFRLLGRGMDGADYRLEIRFEMPLDARTRAVVGELLTQSDISVWRRRGSPLSGRLAARRERAPRR